MDESKKNLLVTLEGASGLYGDLRGRILNVESELGAEIEGLNESLSGYVTTSSLQAGLATKADTSYVNTELDKKANKSDLTSALIYKGSVDNYSNLPSNAATGDVYNVKNANGSIPAGTNYAWTGTEWDALGGTVSVDLSTYATKEALETGLAAKQDTITVTANKIIVSDANGKVASSSVSSDQIAWLDDVTGPIQAQLDDKADIVHGVHVGDVPFTTMPTSGYYLKIIGTDPATASFTWDIPSKKELGIEQDIIGILQQLGEKADKSDLDSLTNSLAKVATSGLYNDLIDKPTIATYEGEESDIVKMMNSVKNPT